MNLKEIDKTVGLNVSQFCQNYSTQNENHCAHFVCHLLGLGFGYTCVSFKGNHGSPAANIRVHELFRQCVQVGPWGQQTGPDCFIFVTKANQRINYRTKTFPNINQKHVGIYRGGWVYHYSNHGGHKVLKQTLPQFQAHMAGAYGPIQIAYGSMPV